MLTFQNNLFARFVFLTGFILLLSACNSRPNGVLNERQMTNVLTDMHKTDAVLNEKGLAYGHYTEKAAYYKFIFKKYKITKAQFDSSLVWYSKNPRIFDNMYDKVMINLTSLQKEVKNGKYHPVDTLDLTKMRTSLWNKRNKYILTHDSVRTHLNFEIINTDLLFGDVYELKFLQLIAPEDSCKKPRIILKINYVNGKTDSVYRTAYNDSLLRRYTFRLTAFRKLKIKSVSGELLASKKYSGKQNVKIDSISLIRIYNVKKQDSLRKVVEPSQPGMKLAPGKSNTNIPGIIKKFINRRFYHTL